MNYHDPLANVPYQNVRINGYAVSAQLVTVPIHGKLFRLSARSFRDYGRALDARDGWNRVKNKDADTEYRMESAYGSTPAAAPAGCAPAGQVSLRNDGDNVVLTIPRSAIR